MVTKFSSYKSLVNNDFTAENFSNNKIFRVFLNCKFHSYSCKKIGNTSFSPIQESSFLRIQGLATTYNNSDLTNDVIANGAFLSNADSDGFLKQMPKMFFEHDSSIVPGIWKSVRLTKIGIEVEGEVTSSSIINLIETDKLNSLSIGFYIVDHEIRYNFVKNQNYRYIKAANLVEISLVKNPANSKAFFSPVEPLYFGDKGFDYQVFS